MGPIKTFYCIYNSNVNCNFFTIHRLLENQNFAKLYNGEDSLVKKNILDFEVKKKNILEYIKEI